VQCSILLLVGRRNARCRQIRHSASEQRISYAW
jgi:hypothetical protein